MKCWRNWSGSSAELALRLRLEFHGGDITLNTGLRANRDLDEGPGPFRRIRLQDSANVQLERAVFSAAPLAIRRGFRTLSFLGPIVSGTMTSGRGF
jgi:hypothetical protein